MPPRPRRSPSRAGATTTPTSGTTRSSRPSRSQAPRHQGRVHADAADRIQRRAQRAARRRHRRRPHHLPAVRRLARRCSRRATSTSRQRPAGHGELLRRGQERLDHRRRQDHLLRADGLGHPRLHLQQGDLRRAEAHAAEDPGRVPRRPRQDQGGRQLHAARHGHRRPVGSRHHGLPEHRPELLEGRGGPQGADRRHGEVHRPPYVETCARSWPAGRPTWATATRRRNIPTARTSSPSAARRSIRPARGTSPTFSKQADFKFGAFPPPRPEGRRQVLHQRPHRHRASASTPSRRTPKPPRPSWPGWPRPSSPSIYANALPGFFPLSNAKVEVKDPVAAEVRRLARHLQELRSATPTRSCRAARRTSRTSSGT